MGTAALVGLGLLALLFLTFAIVGALHVTRGTPVERVCADGASGGRGDGELPEVSDPAFARLAALVARTPLAPGHAVDVLANGDETYPRLWADLREATRSITVQLYYCQPGRMAAEFAEVLAERARSGVDVRFLYDAFGGQRLREEYLDALRLAGVRVAAFRPLRGHSLHKVQHRSHVRLVVADGRVAYTGGFGLDDKWYGDGRTRGQWRDTNVRCTGPSVPHFQSAFVGGWAEATGELLVGDAFFPSRDAAGASDGVGAYAGLLFTVPALGSTDAERFLALTIAAARRTLFIANAYFAPDDDFRRFLTSAARRGVDVRVLTAGGDSDVKTVWYAGRARYEELLEGGVRIYEYAPTMMHAKTLVADGVWATIGSMSFDNRALALNDESTLVMCDRTVGERMEEMFLDDLRHAREVRLDEWRRRPWRERAIEAGANLLSRVL